MSKGFIKIKCANCGRYYQIAYNIESAAKYKNRVYIFNCHDCGNKLTLDFNKAHNNLKKVLKNSEIKSESNSKHRNNTKILNSTGEGEFIIE